MGKAEEVLRLFLKPMLFLFLNLNLFLLENSFSTTSKIRYPWVSFVEGKSSWVDEDGKEHVIKKSTVFLIKARIKTEAQAKLRIELDPNSNLTVLEDSEIVFPVIGWEKGRVEKIDVEKGRVAYDCHDNCEVHIDTPIFQSIFEGGKYVLSYNPNIPQIKLAVIEGHSSFRGLSNEKSIELQAGEEAQFKGVFENGEIAFDTLLHGKKIAKGQMEPKRTIDAKELSLLKKSFIDKKEIKKVLIPIVKRTEKQICDKPFGEFNQCAWIRKGKSCFRYRCNANGEWTDQRELRPTDKRCGSAATSKSANKPIVQNCDD